MEEEDFVPAWSRDSVSTFCSELSRYSAAASSVFSHDVADTRASTCTNITTYSTASSASASSSHHPTTARLTTDRSGNLSHGQQQHSDTSTTTQPSTSNSTRLQKKPLAERKVNNGFACSHCPNTFSKKDDRRKHFQSRCKRLGDGMVCRACNHIGRNAYQINNHASLSGHHKECDQIRLSQKRAFTCSNDGKIYYNAEQFLRHFQEDSDCVLNHYNGDQYHHERVCTLLLEGIGRSSQHKNSIDVYYALLKHCRRHGLEQSNWRQIVYSHSSDTARAFADRLEWGLVADDGSALSRLGYTDLSEMIGRILTPTRNSTSTFLQDLVSKPLPTLPQSARADLEDSTLLSSVPSVEHSYTTTPAYECPDVADWSIPNDFNLWMAGLAGNIDEQPNEQPNLSSGLQKQPAEPYVDSPAVIAAGEMLRGAQLIASPRRGIRRAKRPTSIISDIHPDALARHQRIAEPGSHAESIEAPQPGSGESMSVLFDLRGYYGGTPPLPTPREEHYNTIRPSPEKDVTALPPIPGHSKTPPETPKFAKEKPRGFLKIFTSPGSRERGRHAGEERATREEKVAMPRREDRTQKRQGGLWDHWHADNIGDAESSQ